MQSNKCLSIGMAAILIFKMAATDNHVYFDIVSNCWERTMQITVIPCELVKWYIGSWGTEFLRKSLDAPMHSSSILDFKMAAFQKHVFPHISKNKRDRKFISVAKTNILNQCSQINGEALGWQPYWFSRWPPFKHIYFDIVSNCRERTIQIKIRPCEMLDSTLALEEQNFWGKICIHPPFWILKWPPSENMFFSIFPKLRGIGSSFQWQN